MRLDLYLFGYKRFTVEEKNRARAITALLNRNLSLKMDGNGSFLVPLLRCKKYVSALGGLGYTQSEACGLPQELMKLCRRYGAVSALAVVALYFIFVSGFIWDIRIEGNESVPSSAIEQELADIGFGVGERWRSLSLSEVERDLLEASDTVGWVNVNRKGNVAYVTVKEKTVYEESEENTDYSNIVAAADCVIEEITVKSGVACVKAGDTVKAGDLLISGIIPAELGGGFVRAEGEVLGRVSEELYVEVPREETVKAYGEESICEVRVRIFKFSINIFKNYRKTDTGCAIIEDVEKCVVLGKYRLPVEITKIYTQPIGSEQRIYSDKEIVSVASSRLAKLRVLRLSDSELVRMSTGGEFTDNGYKMTAAVTVIKDIGEERGFE